jgi:multiple sugar transport system permease protein
VARTSVAYPGQIKPRVMGILAALRLPSVLAVAFLLAYLLFTLFPIYWIVVSSLKLRVDTLTLPPTLLFIPNFSAYENIFAFQFFHRFLLNTVIVAISTTAIALAVGSPAAYAIDRYPFRFSNMIVYAMLATRMIFPIVYAIPFFVLYHRLGELTGFRLLDTQIGLIIAHTTFSLPYALWIMSGFFSGIPTEIDDAAMVDGCSRFGAFWRVILPLTAPGLGAAAIFIILLSWNEFLFALVLAGGQAKTLTVAASQLITQISIEWNQLCAVGTVTILPLLAVFSLIYQYLAKGMVAGATKG